MTFLLIASSIVAVNTDEQASLQFSSALDPLSWNYPAALQATLGALGKGVNCLSSGRTSSVLAALPDDNAAASTAVGDYILLFKARAYLELDSGKEALNLFRALQSRYPDSSVYPDAVIGEARALLILHDPEAALAALNREKLGHAAEISYLRAQALEAEGKRAEAIQLYLRIYSESVDSSQSGLAERRLRSLAPSFLSRAENREILLRRAENLIRAGRSQDARTLLLKLAGARASGPQAEKLNLLLGDADTNLKRLSEALRYLRRVTDPALAAQAAYLEGVSLRGLKNEAAFLATRARALRLYPESPYTEKLLYSVATYYDVENEAGPARDAYQTIVRGFPKGEYIERALWKLALYSYVEKRYDEALTWFWQCLLANMRPSAASAPAYWMGRCCERLGDPERAAYFFRRAQVFANNSYYGQRAMGALAVLRTPAPAASGSLGVFDFEQARQKLDAIRRDPATIAEPSGAAALIIERARQLAAAGLLDLALAELDHGWSDGGGNDKALCYSMSRIYQGKDDFYGAISSLRRAFPDYIDLPPAWLPEEIWDILFPVRHLNLVAQNAAKNDLDPDLVLALIRQESAFLPSARSSANARGLMQVLPSTGRLLARQAGIPRYTVSKLYSPDTNIALGTRYLASLLKQYGGKVELALAAYNAGDSRVDLWLQEFGDVDMAEFVERIPFSETRGYVKQVMSNMAHYHLRTIQNSESALGFRKE